MLVILLSSVLPSQAQMYSFSALSTPEAKLALLLASIAPPEPTYAKSDFSPMPIELPFVLKVSTVQEKHVSGNYLLFMDISSLMGPQARSIQMLRLSGAIAVCADAICHYGLA